MKKSNLFLLVILSFFFSGLYAQTADEIIQKHIDAHGGLEKWENVQNLKIEGSFTSFSIEKPITAYITNKGEYYADRYLGEKAIIEAFNGKSGWTIDPWMEIYHARDLGKNEINAFFQKARFFTPFYKYKERGDQVKYIGLDNIDGMEMYHLELTKSNGDKESWFLDTSTYLEYLCRSNWVDFGYPAPSEVYFDDFRELEGLVLPYFSDRTFFQRSRILQIDKITVNSDLDPSLLIKPKSNKMEKLSFLEGNWKVEASVWSRMGNWQVIGEHESVISSESTNLLKEKYLFDKGLPTTRIIQYSYSNSNNKYILTIYDELAAENMLLIGDFEEDNSFVAHNLDVSFSEDEVKKDYLFKSTISEITADGFIIESKISMDEGINWREHEKMKYERQK